jgi:hypothetical protein
MGAIITLSGTDAELARKSALFGFWGIVFARRRHHFQRLCVVCANGDADGQKYTRVVNNIHVCTPFVLQSNKNEPDNV